MRILGAVMAGGQSRRFGRDKAHVLVEGVPLWRRQADVLRQAGAEPVVLIRRGGQTAPEGIECWRDGPGGEGPLCGLRSALEPARAPWVAVLAVDMPGIDAAWFDWLLQSCAPGRGAIVRHPEAFEPLAAVYPADALDAVDAQLQSGDYSLQRLARTLVSLGQLAVLPLPPERGHQVVSLNRPPPVPPVPLDP